MPGPSPDRLNQNLWRWNPGISIFQSSPGDYTEQPGLRALLEQNMIYSSVFLNFYVHTNHMGILSTYRCWLSRSGIGPGILYFWRAHMWCLCYWPRGQTSSSFSVSGKENTFKEWKEKIIDIEDHILYHQTGRGGLQERLEILSTFSLALYCLQLSEKELILGVKRCL